MEHTPLTREVIYVPSVEEMEALPDAEEMKTADWPAFQFKSDIAMVITES